MLYSEKSQTVDSVIYWALLRLDPMHTIWHCNFKCVHRVCMISHKVYWHESDKNYTIHNCLNILAPFWNLHTTDFDNMFLCSLGSVRFHKKCHEMARNDEREFLNEFSQSLGIATESKTSKEFKTMDYYHIQPPKFLMLSISIHQILYIWWQSIINSMPKLKITAGRGAGTQHHHTQHTLEKSIWKAGQLKTQWRKVFEKNTVEKSIWKNTVEKSIKKNTVEKRQREDEISKYYEFNAKVENYSRGGGEGGN